MRKNELIHLVETEVYKYAQNVKLTAHRRQDIQRIKQIIADHEQQEIVVLAAALFVFIKSLKTGWVAFGIEIVCTGNSRLRSKLYGPLAAILQDNEYEQLRVKNEFLQRETEEQKRIINDLLVENKELRKQPQVLPQADYLQTLTTLSMQVSQLIEELARKEERIARLEKELINATARNSQQSLLSIASPT